MKVKANILIVDDDQDVLEAAKMFLKEEFSHIESTTDPAELPFLITRTSYDVILLDMNFRKGLNDGKEGFYWLERIRDIDADSVVVLITAYADIDLAVRAMKASANDFIVKPWKNQRMLATVRTALELSQSRRTIRRMEKTQQLLSHDLRQGFDNFIGSSPAINQVRELVGKVAETDASVLVLGENGTGKEVVARAIHQYSNRSDNIFIHVDLGSIAPTLFESELFGHAKGAYTDAHQDRTGRFELADKGTLFLDEIGNLSGTLQAKLLTVLQQKTITPVGKTQATKIDFRLICATNRELYEMVRRDEFRQDLLYRINTVEIRIPPLRERPGDIIELTTHFLDQFSEKYDKSGLTITDEVLDQMQRYRWPGNIRELQHALERAVILTDSFRIDRIGLLLHEHSLNETFGKTPVTMDDAEHAHISKILTLNKGNVTQTAKTLGLTRTALYRRLNKYGMI